MKRLRWIANTYDPKQKDWSARVLREDVDYQAWLSGKIIGEPQVPLGSPHTVEKLKDMHLVGVYVEEEDENSLRNP